MVIAENVEALHGEGNAISKETALDETGAVVNGRGDEPNRHDILTGSLPDGTAAAETCEDWTSGGADTAGMVGHHDRMGLDESDAAKSWNSSHASRGGCGHRGAARHRRRRPRLLLRGRVTGLPPPIGAALTVPDLPPYLAA